jgi:hypothetical protein
MTMTNLALNQDGMEVRMGRNTGATSPRRLAAAERHRKALELRLAGATFGSIARDLAYANEAGPRRAVAKAMARAQALATEKVDELRTLELERLDALQVALWPKRGNPRVTNAILRVMERRAKLIGLDAPVAITGANGAPLLPVTAIRVLLVPPAQSSHTSEPPGLESVPTDDLREITLLP